MRFATTASTALCLALSATAHPGEKHSRALNRPLSDFKNQVRSDMTGCASSLKARGLHDRALARREATFAAKRAAPPHVNRRAVQNPDTLNATSHNHTELAYTSSTAETTVFGSDVCALNPEGETGPYYIPGELVRSDVLEGQPGVPLYLELQLVDVATCEPLVGAYLDLWGCNATGVYSGVVESGNGDGNDTSNADATFLRGLYPTDSDGVVAFQHLVPGHYAGRANHLHIITHLNATLLANNTLTGGTDAHIGQLFFDQTLLDEVEASSPYNTNTIARTKNVDDGVFITEAENTTSDPVVDYAYLGADLSDGLFGWVTVGVNTSAAYDPNYSFVWTADGAVPDTHGENTGSSGWSQVGDWDKK